MPLTRVVIIVVATWLAAFHNAKSASAEDWPAQSLTLVVPFAAGGGTDVMARIIASRMSQLLSRQVTVENMAGAGGMVGSAHVAKSTPDGYTVLVGSRSQAIDMTLYKHPSYSLQDDLAPIALIAEQPTILVARKDLPVDGLKGFAAYVKANASTVRMGAAGVGATGFVDCAIFNGRIGVNIQAIPYRGSGPAIQDLIGGQIDYLCTLSGSAAAPLQNDLIKGIAALWHTRLSSLPNIPTDYEQGMNFEASTWFGLFVRKGTPNSIIKRLHDAAVASIETPSVQQQLAAIGTYVVPTEHQSTEYFESIIGPEIERNAAPLKAAGISAE